MKKIKYNSVAKAIKEINRNNDNDEIRIAIYVTEDDMLTADLQLEYEEQCINISSYEVEVGSIEFWEFFEIVQKKFKNEAEKVKKELEARAYEVTIEAYTC